ncbi:tyrosine-type recombinase/integrase [Frankia gtarii]|uniref:tyrosine-type recombinase/integrase n=1 Tax=Frankia gtarii TaxID=2950102 RepID=UPI0021C13CDC|nr:tyrosine-type recombinase/integrase [Frankia gtarii]
MASTTDGAATGPEPGKFASRKMADLTHAPGRGDDSLTVWVGRYLDLAVRGVRSTEVTGKIDRHLGRFQTWFAGGFGHDRISTVTRREVAGWREHLAASPVRTLADGRVQLMAPATVNNHLAHLSAFFTWTAVHAPAGLLPHSDPTARVELLRLPAPTPRALGDAQVRTVKNVLDRIEGFHRLTGRAHRALDAVPAVHAHARPLRDRAIVHLMLGTGLRRAEVAGLDLTQLDPADPAELRRRRVARLTGVRGKGRTSRTVFLGLDSRVALADYLEHERPSDVDGKSAALFLSASSIATRRAGGRLSPRSINTVIGEIGRIHDLEVTDAERRLGVLRPHDLRHTFGYQLSRESGHNRAELEHRLGHANDRYLRLYTNPPDDVAAGWVENL